MASGETSFGGWSRGSTILSGEVSLFQSFWWVCVSIVVPVADPLLNRVLDGPEDYPVKSASAARIRIMTSKNSPAITKKILSVPRGPDLLEDPRALRFLRLLGFQLLSPP
jgi:hypothetical protein